MPTGAFLIARIDSKRLPGKNMLEILGKPMIALLAERVSYSSLVDKVVIATSTAKSDDPLEELAARLGLDCFRGSLENVMERVACAARHFKCNTVIEILGDNPLVHSDLIDDVLNLYRQRKFDYAATVTKEYPVSPLQFKLFSVGIRVQVYSLRAAERWREYPDYLNVPAKSTSAYIFEHTQEFKAGYLEAKGRWAFMHKPDFNLAVNYAKNFELVRRVFEKNYIQDKNFSLQKVYAQLNDEPHLLSLMGN